MLFIQPYKHRQCTQPAQHITSYLLPRVHGLAPGDIQYNVFSEIFIPGSICVLTCSPIHTTCIHACTMCFLKSLFLANVRHVIRTPLGHEKVYIMCITGLDTQCLTKNTWVFGKGR